LAELKDGGKKTGVCAFFKDLTHVEMAEESENLKHRLLLLGQMAAGLAHEIRNPIASIGVHCAILRSHLSTNEKLEPSVRMIATETDRVEYIIRECLNFVRPAELGIRPLEIHGLLESVIQRAQNLHPGMQFVFKKSKVGDLITELDRGLMEQAISNILLNAAEACGGKGRVEISVGTTRHYSESAKVNRQIETLLPGHPGDERDYARISILDNGPGMSPEIQDRIFAPFYTTKKTGTGIGLPMAQKIIHSHGGVVDLRSTPGKGTEFIVKIPLRQKNVG
jgi:signal transduction histidine kinase